MVLVLNFNAIQYTKIVNHVNFIAMIIHKHSIVLKLAMDVRMENLLHSHKLSAFHNQTIHIHGINLVVNVKNAINQMTMEEIMEQMWIITQRIALMLCLDFL